MKQYSVIYHTSYTSEIPNIEEARVRKRSHVLSIYERFLSWLTPRFLAELTGERVTLFGKQIVRVLGLDSGELLRETNDEKLSFGRITSEKIGRLPRRILMRIRSS